MFRPSSARRMTVVADFVLSVSLDVPQFSSVPITKNPAAFRERGFLKLDVCVRLHHPAALANKKDNNHKDDDDRL